ncbi:hypothetical protein AB0I35_22890 [Nocardia sp. NPDC050378]|uniref:hypothetical protein n=1 Tax=Nocardia sp. NPDC050378 TaxID=3155400 RepID=UPI00340D3F3D
MTDLLTRAQLRMLGQTLRAEPADLDGLARLGAHDLRVLHERISGLLFDADEPVFARLAKLSPLMPNALLTKIAVAAVPPEVGGRAGGSLGLAHPDRIADVLSALPARYLADAAPHLDPRTIAGLAPRLSGQILIPTAVELLRRADYPTAGRFVEHATDTLIDELERGITDDVGLLRAIAVIPDAERLDTVVGRLPAARRAAVLRAAATDSDDAVLAALSVLARLNAEPRAHSTTTLIESLDDEELTRVVSIAVHRQALGELLAALSETSAAVGLRVADIIATASGELGAALADAADTVELRGRLNALRALRA